MVNTYRYMHNIYYTTKLDVIIQCELEREPGGQTSLPDNNLVLVSVNDINSFMTVTNTDLLLQRYNFALGKVKKKLNILSFFDIK